MPLANVIAAHRSWANTPNRTARTSNARNAFEQKFLDENDGDPQRAASARKAFFLELAQKSAKVRQAKRRAKDEARRQYIEALVNSDAAGGDAA